MRASPLTPTQRGHDRAAGELKAKQQAEDDAKIPFKTADSDEAPAKAGTTEHHH
jgi:hypothetical protein